MSILCHLEPYINLKLKLNKVLDENSSLSYRTSMRHLPYGITQPPDTSDSSLTPVGKLVLPRIFIYSVGMEG